MGTYVETIFQCNESDEVLHVLEAFLHDFVESGLSNHIPSELRPVRICSTAEIKSWSSLVRIALEQHANGGNLGHDTLEFLGIVLGAASRHIDVLDSVDYVMPRSPVRLD
jgi:hypothetical protein